MSGSVNVKLPGFFRSDTTLEPGEHLVLDFSFMSGGCSGCFKWLCGSGNVRKTLKNMGRMSPPKEVVIHDARVLEQQEGLSKRAFFEKHGFVLLEHRTAMTAEDWLVNTTAPAPDKASAEKLDSVLKAAPPVVEVYAKEIDPLVRDLLPSAVDVEYPRFVLRRGPGGPNNYALSVHQDYGLYREDMANTVISAKEGSEGLGQKERYSRWLGRMASDDVSGYTVLNLWRPVPPMEGPVSKVPLAVCDPDSVRVQDTVPQNLFGYVPGGQHTMGLKFHPDQRWYFYPQMTKDEVLVHRQFHWQKGVPEPYDRIQTVFHTAFEHPGAPPNAEKRTSSEYRIGVWTR